MSTVVGIKKMIPKLEIYLKYNYIHAEKSASMSGSLIVITLFLSI